MASISTLSKVESAPVSSKPVFLKSEPEKPVAAFKAASRNHLLPKKRLNLRLFLKQSVIFQRYCGRKINAFWPLTWISVFGRFNWKKIGLVCSLTEEAPRRFGGAIGSFFIGENRLPV